jgi:cell division protease FtsH
MEKNKQPQNNKKDWKSIIWYLLTALMIGLIITSYMQEPKPAQEIEFTNFLQQVNSGQIKEVTIQSKNQSLVATTKDGTNFKTFYVDYPNFVEELRGSGVNIKVNPSDSGWFWGVLLQAFLPFLLIGFLWFFIFRQAQGMNGQAMQFGKSRAILQNKEDTKKITFKDVAGIEEAKEELYEIVDFLKSPKKYKDIGAKIPKGALLMGPPGTGKTLLAKAVAGEADVPFFTISGSDFVEMFVGVGASRVRDLFAKAKKSQPCLIFVDEIDAVGRHRGAGLGGGHDEREQTLNQLLVEMDGFGTDDTVIVIAATNRPDILDPALLRPGRFDRQIVVDKPDIKGREDILKIHAKGKKLGRNINLNTIAKRTPGFTGADLHNLMNESALLAARKGKKTVSMQELEEATDRVMAGPERKSRLLTGKEKEIVAYHEMGHAIVAFEIPDADPVHKVSILPRGMALGYTLQVPTEDKHLISRTEIENNIKILMGGRIAEDLIFNEITSGASNDIERATELARNYVCKFGMSKKLGTRKYGSTDQNVFLGKSYSNQNQDYSDETARLIDEEVQKLIDSCYKEATSILTKHKKSLVDMSKLIMEKEVLDAEEFKTLYEESKGTKPAAKKTAASKTRETKEDTKKEA